MNTRIAGYDFARSLALFGLVAANFSGDVEHADLYLLDTLILRRSYRNLLGAGRNRRISSDATGSNNKRCSQIRG